MTKVTVFVGCDFFGTGPRKFLDKFLRSFSKKSLRVIPLFSCSDNREIVEVFGREHPDYEGLIGSDGLMGKILALIKNSDFVIFDLTGYRPGRKYCLNVIYELGIAMAFARGEGKGKNLTWRFFAKKGLRYYKDISDLSGENPLFFGYKHFRELEKNLSDNLEPLIYIKQGGKVRRKPSQSRPKRKARGK